MLPTYPLKGASNCIIASLALRPVNGSSHKGSPLGIAPAIAGERGLFPSPSPLGATSPIGRGFLSGLLKARPIICTLFFRSHSKIGEVYLHYQTKGAVSVETALSI